MSRILYIVTTFQESIENPKPGNWRNPITQITAHIQHSLIGQKTYTFIQVKKNKRVHLISRSD